MHLQYNIVSYNYAAVFLFENWILQESGKHNHTLAEISIGTVDKTTGMHTKSRDEVDRMVKVGLTPQKVLLGLKQLVLIYPWVDYKQFLPSLQQIINRRKVLGNLGVINIDIVADLEVIF